MPTIKSLLSVPPRRDAATENRFFNVPSNTARGEKGKVIPVPEKVHAVCGAIVPR